MNTLRRTLLASVLAFILSALSVFVERTGPETASFGNMCGPAANESCMEPLLKGGYPIAFLFDQPGVSVQHQLSFVEDEVRIGALAFNTALYLAAIVLASTLLRKNNSQ